MLVGGGYRQVIVWCKMRRVCGATRRCMRDLLWGMMESRHELVHQGAIGGLEAEWSESVPE